VQDVVKRYLRDVATIRRSGAGTQETSYYPPLRELLDGIGGSLRPKVRTIFQLKNTGAGIPDGGLFTVDQLKLLDIENPVQSQPPARGVLEVKGAGDDVVAIAQTEQVRRYAEQYGQVLVTNLRDFLLVDRDHDGRIRTSERCTLAPDESAFWKYLRQPDRLADILADQLAEYLHRVMVRSVSLAQPKDVALLLASYARDMRARLEQQSLGDLKPLRDALEEALGLRFQGENGDHFFRSTVVQTLFYGLFSAWVLQARGVGPRSPTVAFDWRLAGWSLKVPAIQSLFHEFAKPDSVQKLGLKEVLDWTGEMLNRIDTERFFSRFAEHDAIQYFYEPFLEAFDPELRKQLGVWYTPHEVVSYMVERVDQVLRTELGVRRGLADPNVYVLDPCTGTGSYLVATLRRIHRTLNEEGSDALTANDLKVAATNRLFGFELLPAPFVVAHLQLGLTLQELGASLKSGTNERPGVYLTNALTGWEHREEPLKQAHMTALLGDLQKERDAADGIKREKPILVVIGNPPYNGYAGVAVDEERQLTVAYREAKTTRQPQGQGLNDLYVRFFRMAERRIVEQTGKGIVCLISNYSWLDGLSFTAMRERYLEAFDRVWIDNLNGDKYKTGKVAPDGSPDPSIFSTATNREGIQVGTAIALLAQTESQRDSATVRYREFWGTGKLGQLQIEACGEQPPAYQELTPAAALGYPFLPSEQHPAYLTWPKLPDLFPVSFPGVKTSRDDVVVDIDRDRLIARMRQYFDPSFSNAQIGELMPSAIVSSGQFKASAARMYLVKRGFLPDRIIRYAYRPFDVRWLYWEPETYLLDRKREDFEAEVIEGNHWFSAGQRNRMSGFYRPQVGTALADHHIVESNAAFFPMRIRQASLLQSKGIREAKLNLSGEARQYAESVTRDPSELFFHALAVLHSPAYVAENAAGLRHDWPRVPLPQSGSHLAASADLGRQVGALLDVETKAPGVLSGKSRPELRGIAVLATTDGRPVDVNCPDLALTAGWGYGGKGKPVMPGHGRVQERSATPEEVAPRRAALDPLGLDQESASRQLGIGTVDIFLNDRVYWRNVPERVWAYQLGGYPVLKKWLSYREERVLGRPLRPEEARLFSEIAGRIAAILLLEPTLDANYHRVSANTWDWPSTEATGLQQSLWS
jgi:hypothetical protein